MDKKPGIRPRITIWHQLDVAARYAFPLALTMLVLLLLSAPLGIPGQAQMQPAWALASIYFWTLFRPASLPAFGVFSVGLLLDLLAQGPVGISVLILLLAHATALRGRRWLARQGFALVWLVFVLFAGVAAMLEWLLVAVLTWRALPPWPALFEWGVAAGFYPILATLLTQAHRSIAAPELA
jgi:rod shape-determining protein MreD